MHTFNISIYSLAQWQQLSIKIVDGLLYIITGVAQQGKPWQKVTRQLTSKYPNDH